MIGRLRNEQTDKVGTCPSAHRECNSSQQGFRANYAQRSSTRRRDRQKTQESAIRLIICDYFRKGLHLPHRGKTKLKVTDFVVGSDLAYVVNGNKAKLKSSSGKQVDCTIVRVANAAAAIEVTDRELIRFDV